IAWMGGYVEIVMGQYSINNLLIIAAFTQPLCQDSGMFAQIWVFLVIGIVQQSRHGPQFFVFAIFAGIETHSSFNRKHMLLEIFIFYVACHQLISIITCWHCSQSFYSSISRGYH